MFDSKIPQITRDIREQVIEAWKKYLREIQSHLAETTPALQVAFMDIHGQLGSVAEEFCGRVVEIVECIRKRSREARSVFSDSVRAQLCGIFHAAAAIRGESPGHIPASIYLCHQSPNSSPYSHRNRMLCPQSYSSYERCEERLPGYTCGSMGGNDQGPSGTRH